MKVAFLKHKNTKRYSLLLSKMKKNNKSVTYNDILLFNHIIGKALIENDSEKIDSKDLDFILTKQKNIDYWNSFFSNCMLLFFYNIYGF